MVIGFLVSEIVDIASLAVRGASAVYTFFFSVEKKSVETHMKLMQQIEALEKMCADLSQQRIDDIKRYAEEINDLRKILQASRYHDDGVPSGALDDTSSDEASTSAAGVLRGAAND